jgi:hypothetical protein
MILRLGERAEGDTRLRARKAILCDGACRMVLFHLRPVLFPALPSTFHICPLSVQARLRPRKGVYPPRFLHFFLPLTTYPLSEATVLFPSARRCKAKRLVLLARNLLVQLFQEEEGEREKGREQGRKMSH